MELKFSVQAKIAKPRAEVFDAVDDPSKLSAYFTTGGSSGPLRSGGRIIWKFADYPGDIPVEVKKVVANERIVFEWAAEEPAADYHTIVEMEFKRLDASSTQVVITESGWRETQKGLDSSYLNCHGWTQMLCCLKTWLEHGINLREGFY